MQAASFRTPRSSPPKTKRARSPPSPTTLETRPTKRLSIGRGDTTRHVCPPIRARQGSEDWVVQTRSLRIDRDSYSPAAEPRPFPTIPEEPIQGVGQEIGSADMDEDMIMEEDDGQDSYVPFACPPNSPAKMPVSTASSPSVCHSSFDRLSYPLYLDPSHNHQERVSETSPEIASSQSSNSSDQMQDSQTLMPVAPTTPSRKQKFTMGPRNDCLKCRMGVKGHWMHI